MFKIRAIALREYLSAVRAKAFIVSILLMPVLMGASIGLQVLFKKLDDAKEKSYAVIDRSADQQVGKKFKDIVAAIQAAKAKNAELSGLFPVKSAVILVPPSEATPAAMAEQRYELSKQIESGELEALIEIGVSVLDIRPGDMFVNADKVDDQHAIRYQAKNAGALQFRKVAGDLVNQSIQLLRFQQKGLSTIDIGLIQQSVPLKTKALTKRDAATGEYKDAADESQVINILLPAVLIGMMFMIVMVGATPAMHGVIEEKALRIAEVLLGSVTPFQLMAGKLLGVIGVALTIATVYLGGGLLLAWYFGFADLLPLGTVLWFLPMLVLELLIFGSLFIAVGAAAADIKDTQALLMPLMLIACLPLFALVPIIQDPSGPIARVCSLFPFSTPMLLVARQSVPPGVPWWEMLCGIILVLATTLACVWAAGRIFRVGLLMQGKGPKFGDLIRWAIKG
jgi:ABC-2 type transport system permease protein